MKVVSTLQGRSVIVRRRCKDWGPFFLFTLPSRLEGPSVPPLEDVFAVFVVDSADPTPKVHPAKPVLAKASFMTRLGKANVVEALGTASIGVDAR